LWAEANTIQVSALLKLAIAQWVFAFGLPVRAIAWMGVLCPQKVIAVGEEREEGVRFRYGLKPWWW
jgi:hypothetical protein